jgi:signal transduction histidine kinase
MSEDPRSVGFPPGHPPMESFLGVPIHAGDEILGNLYLTDRVDGEPFTAADQRLVERLADHAALAIQNARLYEQVERLAVLEERTRIGMDLHDGVIQSIYGVGLTLESARMTIPESGAAETCELLDLAMKGLDDAIRDIRSFILDLRPRRFRGNLIQGVSQLVREFQANTMIPVDLYLPPEESLADLPPGMARAAFLTTQEALANVARHARATEVTVKVKLENGYYIEIIDDNGAGFDLDNHAQRIGHGLANMQTRAEELGGHFNIVTSPGEGTRLELQMPLKPFPLYS